MRRENWGNTNAILRSLQKTMFYLIQFSHSFSFQEVHPEYSDHTKFTNYAFDVCEFTTRMDQVVIKVKQSLEDYKK